MAQASSLAELVADWSPAEMNTERVVDRWVAEAFLDLVDAGRQTAGFGTLPPLWHWLFLLDHPRSDGIGDDGHATNGPFQPPLPNRRRMVAGGRLRQYAEVPFGTVLRCRSAMSSVVPKTGRSGDMLFVTVRHLLISDGAEVAVEEQDVVYRSVNAGASSRVLSRPAPEKSTPTGEWQLRRPLDPVLLARFSALTYNGHRIHYDRDYASEVEGFPDLVVHGPLMALLALELPRRFAPADRVTEVTYRLTRPAFLPDALIAHGAREGDRARIAVGSEGVAPSLEAEVRFR